MKKLVNGVEVDMTPEEVIAFEAARTPTLPQARKLMRERIAARRVKAEQGGFLYLTARYDSDGNSLARLAVLASRAKTAKANNETVSVTLIAADDTQSQFNANELIALEVSAGDHFIACSANAKTLRQAVNQAVDVAAVLAVDLEVGWP